VLVVPTLFGCASLGLLIWDHFQRVNNLALVLASAASLLVVARLILTFAEKAQMLARSRADAMSDPLTRLGNRRKLLDDLAGGVTSATSGAPLLVVLLDLDGFKSYNDLYGHAAGDALLARIAARLDAAVGQTGSAYRMGGDEFCALFPAGAEDPGVAVQRLTEAVSESGSSWTIRASAGHALAPTEATSAAESLRLADARMYATKQRRLPASNRVLSDVLERLTEARDGGLNAHSRAVADLAEDLAAQLRLPAEDCDQIRLAAQLHDIGKLALPDSIASQGRLEEDDWLLVRQHTLVGAKVLSGTTALAEVARLVRASHERWDGTGYPDNLAGEEIPLGSRIIFCCDAYDTMVRGRPYQVEMAPQKALDELRRCAGTQFDPGVVGAFARMLARREQLRLAS